MTTLIIRESKNGAVYAALIVVAKYSDLIEESKTEIQTDAFRLKLEGYIADKMPMNGKPATKEDIDLAIAEMIESMNNAGQKKEGKKDWAEYYGDGFICHKTTGVKYVQGYTQTILLEAGENLKPRRSRTGKTLAKKYARKILPMSQWKMIQVDGARLVLGSDEAWKKWNDLKEGVGTVPFAKGSS